MLSLKEATAAAPQLSSRTPAPAGFTETCHSGSAIGFHRTAGLQHDLAMQSNQLSGQPHPRRIAASEVCSRRSNDGLRLTSPMIEAPGLETQRLENVMNDYGGHSVIERTHQHPIQLPA